MLRINNLHKTFNRDTENEINIFHGLDLEIKKGELVAILGGNGCGKTTLFNLISRALTVDGGSITLDGESIEGRSEEQVATIISKVHQNPSMGVSPSLTILENLSLADKKSKRFGLKRLLKNSREEEYKEMLKHLDLGLENKLNVKVKHLSGGQRQALSLIMATLHSPKLLLLDEHTAALDPKTSKLIMDKTKELIEKSGITTMMISHNLRDAINYSTRVIMLEGGQVILDKPSKDLTEDELIQIYAKNLRTA